MIKSSKKMGLTKLLLNYMYQGIFFNRVIVKYAAWFLYNKLYMYILYYNREDFYCFTYFIKHRVCWEKDLFVDY